VLGREDEASGEVLGALGTAGRLLLPTTPLMLDARDRQRNATVQHKISAHFSEQFLSLVPHP